MIGVLLFGIFQKKRPKIGCFLEIPKILDKNPEFWGFPSALNTDLLRRLVSFVDYFWRFVFASSDEVQECLLSTNNGSTDEFGKVQSGESSVMVGWGKKFNGELVGLCFLFPTVSILFFLDMFFVLFGFVIKGLLI